MTVKIGGPPVPKKISLRRLAALACNIILGVDVIDLAVPTYRCAGPLPVPNC